MVLNEGASTALRVATVLHFGATRRALDLNYSISFACCETSLVESRAIARIVVIV